jgi:hypothetical protein
MASHPFKERLRVDLVLARRQNASAENAHKGARILAFEIIERCVAAISASLCLVAQIIIMIDDAGFDLS